LTQNFDVCISIIIAVLISFFFSLLFLENKVKFD